MKKIPILVAAAIIAASFCDIVNAQTLEIQLNSRTYTNGYEVSCHGAQNGSIEAICINGNEPFAYQWSNGATTQTIDNLAAGTYTVTVYDWNNNSGQKEIILREPDVLEAFLTADVCAGGTNICQQGASTGHIYSEISGGAPPYAYLWNTGSTSQSLTGVPAGTYTLTIADINSCTSSQHITLTEPSALHIVSITSPLHHGFNVSCNGQSDGAITLNVAGGVPPYSYQWNNGSMDQNPQSLAARVYMVKVYDQNGAMVTGQITLTQPPAIVIETTPYVYSNGFNLSTFNSLDGSITTNVTGGATPYTYTWQTIPQKTTANITNLSAGGYELMLYDANGCYSSQSTVLKEPERDDWTMTGNAGTNPANQFIGTTDNTDLVFKTYNSERLRVQANGDLKVGSLAGSSYNLVYADSNGVLSKAMPSGTIISPQPWLSFGNTMHSQEFLGTLNNFPLIIKTNANGLGGGERMRITETGNVGIGTTTPTAKIDVSIPATATSKAIAVTNGANTEFLVYGNGQVYAREVTVKTGTFPDYVFSKNYKPISIENLENYISTYQHLPEMPTANEVEINGQALGEVQTLLVKKVEELTLYLIDQNKRIKLLEEHNKTLTQQLKQINSHK